MSASTSSHRLTLLGLFLFFVGVAGMALALYELRQSNPLPPGAWTVPTLLGAAILTVFGLYMAAWQHWNRP